MEKKKNECCDIILQFDSQCAMELQKQKKERKKKKRKKKSAVIWIDPNLLWLDFDLISNLILNVRWSYKSRKKKKKKKKRKKKKEVLWFDFISNLIPNVRWS